MQELEKLKADYKIFKYATEEEFNDIQKKFKATLAFIESEKEKTLAMDETFRNLAGFMKDVIEKFEIKDIQTNALNNLVKSLEVLIKTQDLKIQMLETKIEELIK